MGAVKIKDGPAKGLTYNRDKFCHEVAQGASMSAAYRTAYDAHGMKPTSVNERASRLMRDPLIQARVLDLKLPVTVASTITLESHLNDLLTLRDEARASGQTAAAVTAEIARAKAAGIVSDRLKIDHSGTVAHVIVPMRADELRGRIRGVVIDGQAQRLTAPSNGASLGATLGATRDAALHKLQ